jgi:apolipoprotein N-acyltransferase
LFRKQTGAAAPHRFSRVLLAMILLTVGAWAGTAAYGLWRLKEPAGPRQVVVTSIQTCIPQDVKKIVKGEQMHTVDEREKMLEEVHKAEREMLDTQIRLTHEALKEARAKGLTTQLIVWPETMVPGVLNQEFLEYDPTRTLLDRFGLDSFQDRSRRFWEMIRNEAGEAGAPILFGGHSADLLLRTEHDLDFINQQNTAFLLKSDTPEFRSEHTYSKYHLVPFGEYLPFRESLPWLHEFLLSFTPYDYDYSLKPGDRDQAPFILNLPQGEVRFQVPICYEDAMPYRVREMVRSDNPMRPKAVDFLVNISNDGWFDGSVELDQHLALCVFRAVENRVPIVRSVNTGISAIINSDGRIEQAVEADGRRRPNVTGSITGPLVLDDRVAPYTRLGDIFAQACLVGTVLLALAAWALSRKNRRNA